MATGEVAMAYTRAAMERAMKVADVLLHALKERQPWIHVAEVLGVSPRTVRRLRWRYEHHGFEGLFDHRHQRPSPRFRWWHRRRRRAASVRGRGPRATGTGCRRS